MDTTQNHILILVLCCEIRTRVYGDALENKWDQKKGEEYECLDLIVDCPDMVSLAGIYLAQIRHFHMTQG